MTLFKEPFMKKDPYILYYKENASPEEEHVLLQGVIDEAAKAHKKKPITPFSFFIKDFSHALIAGIKGTTLYGCLYVDLLWVDSRHRNKGLGTDLMEHAEKLGIKRGCTFASLTTMDWEALPFYQDLGYEVEYVREGYENNSKMYILRKPL